MTVAAVDVFTKSFSDFKIDRNVERLNEVGDVFLADINPRNDHSYSLVVQVCNKNEYVQVFPRYSRSLESKISTNTETLHLVH